VIRIHNLKNFYAVSAVIGIILMVAITVAIAAVSYAYFTGLIGASEEVVPVMQFEARENLDRIEILSSEKNVRWNQFNIRSDKEHVTYDINTNIGIAGGTPLQIHTVHELTKTDIINPSDFIEFKGHDGVNPVSLSEVTITIIHRESGTVLYIFQFRSIAAASD
jgi:FlaG/FlaF family flagellin (archaellin)